jgi:hypothetical protein
VASTNTSPQSTAVAPIARHAVTAGRAGGVARGEATAASEPPEAPDGAGSAAFCAASAAGPDGASGSRRPQRVQETAPTPASGAPQNGQ